MNRFLFPLLFLASSSWTLLGDVLFSLPFEHSVLPERAMGDRNAGYPRNSGIHGRNPGIGHSDSFRKQNTSPIFPEGKSES